MHFFDAPDGEHVDAANESRRRLFQSEHRRATGSTTGEG
jgi:hypothetical protein